MHLRVPFNKKAHDDEGIHIMLPWADDKGERRYWPHALYLIAVFAYITGGVFSKFAGTTGFIIFLGAILLYCLLARAFYFYASLAIFTLIGIAYIFLSYANVLPSAWTTHFDPDYVLRHGYFVLALYPMMCASQRFWTHSLKAGFTGRYFLLLILGGAVIRSLLQTIFLPDRFERNIFGVVTFFFYGLVNAEMVILAGLTYYVIVMYPHKLWLTIIPFTLFVFLTSSTIQVSIVAPMVLMLVLLPKTLRPWLIAGVVLAMFSGGIAGMFYIEQLAQNDANTALRQIYWRDALAGISGTLGVGIGFGREVTGNAFYEYLDFIPFDYANLMGNGIHNSYISMFFRLGLMGGLAFAIFVFYTCFPINIRDSHMAAHAAIVYFMAFMSMFVNVGIESPRAIVGITVCLGYVLAAKSVYGKGPRAVTITRRPVPPAPAPYGRTFAA